MKPAAPDPARSQRLEMFRAIAKERLTRLNLLWVQLEQGLAPEGAMTGLLRELHTLKGEASLMGYSGAVALVHALEDLLGPQAQGAAAEPVVGDLLLRGLDLVLTTIEGEADAHIEGAADFLEQARRHRQKGGAGGSAKPPPPSGGAAARERVIAVSTGDSVRVTSAKLDRMRDIIGELMLTQTRLELSAKEFRKARETTLAQETQREKELSATHVLATLLEHIAGIEARLRDDSYRISGLVAELDGAARELRMVPIRTLFEQYPLAIRELGRELGREVRIEFDGETVEVDRSVLDRLADPVLHLLRNAVDHGIEPPEVRRRSGKPAEGKVTVRAKLRGHSLEIAVLDDGAGIDAEGVRLRAVELGLLDAPAARSASDEQVLRTLFDARMSTRKTITKVSGRGIGLNVVLTHVEELGGTVTVKSSSGIGTTFQLSVPVTLAMTSIVLFDVGTTRYALPAATMVALVEASTLPAVASIDGPKVRYDGALLPLLALDELLGEASLGAGRADSAVPARLMIVSRGSERLALSGTSHHFEREVICKGLGKFFQSHRLVTAAVPLEDGSLALVLSVSELFTGPRGGRLMRQGTAPAKREIKTVLVVDDSPVVRDLLAESLRAHGLRVLEASDGQEALHSIDNGPAIDLVVTDVDMPRLDGIGLIKKLRQRSTPRRLPVVIVSMRGSSEDQQRAIDAGADAYLVKTDLSHASLFTMLSRFLG